jgi:TIR domain
MRAAQIFISYRRDDAAGYARAVYDELARHFGADRVFIDVDDIDAGERFGEVIQRAMGESQVLLVLIGKRWQGEREGGALPRLRDPADLVRKEVATGLARGMVVMPLLLDGAAMPTEAQLPDELRALAQRNALEIGNTRFAADVERLVAALREALGEPAPPAPRRAATVGWVLAGGALVAAIAGTLWYARTPADGDRAALSAPAPRASKEARLAINGSWLAQVDYDWPNAHHAERFVFGGEGGELHGSASFLGVARGVLEGSVEPDGLRFVTRTSEMGAAGTVETVHRYRGRLVGDELRFVMQTEGSSSAHVPVEFVARREPAAASQVGR